VQHGQREAGGLAGAGLGCRHQVATGENLRNGLGLDRGGRGVAGFGNGALDGFAEGEIGKADRNRCLGSGFTLGLGFALGVYALPILIAPDAPTEQEIKASVPVAQWTATFRRDLKDSDALHWGEGTVSISPQAISLVGKLAPGPDYKLYLSPEFVETEADFKRLKPQMQRVGDVKTFSNFIVPVPQGVDLAKFNTVIVWCETFSEFITAAQYQ
jgi:hypothetical protein